MQIKQDDTPLPTEESAVNWVESFYLLFIDSSDFDWVETFYLLSPVILFIDLSHSFYWLG